MGSGKLTKVLVGLIITASVFLTAPSVIGNAAGEDLAVSGIEQIYVNMPEMRAYFTKLDENISGKGNITAFFKDDNNKDVTVNCIDVKNFSETGDGIDYYVLLDTSASISEDTFSKLKKAVISVNSSLGKNDRMTLVTFGDSADPIYRSDKSDEALDSVLSGIKATSGSTSLYHALAKTAELAEQNNNDGYKRKECILYTDGYDEAAGKETIDETKADLLKYNIPVYTVSAVGSASEDNSKLGELSRTTGGRIIVPTAGKTYTDMTEEILSEIKGSKVVIFEADNNIIPRKEVTLSVKFRDIDVTSKKDVYMTHSQPDNTAPKIEKAELDGTDRIKIYFSENVSGADNIKNFTVTNSSQNDLLVKEASYEVKNSQYIATITIDSEIIKDDYIISCQNICDVSMEKNNISNTLKVYLDGIEGPNMFIQALLSWQGIILAAVIVIATVVLVIVIVRVRRKRAAAQNQPPVVHVVQPVIQPVVQQPPAQAPAQTPAQQPQEEAQNSLAQPQQQIISGIEKKAPKYVVNIKETNSIMMNIQLDGGESKPVEIEFEDRLVVGRSSSCDVCIDDKYMARNQFFIEKEGGCYYLTDLNSTNGTMLNGIRIHEKQRLEKNDVITAGTVRMTVSWN